MSRPRQEPRRPVMDGPFTETKEVVLGYWSYRAGGYAPVNGLRMYYEVHGHGRPLVLLHGGLSTIDTAFGAVLHKLAATRQVIAIEQQAHGRTADVDRPLSYAQMASDTAALLGHLGVEQADLLGWSMGASVAFQLAVNHPRLTRRMAIVAGGYSNDGLVEKEMELVHTIESSPLAVPIREAFERVAATPGQWSRAVKKVSQMFSSKEGLRRDQLRFVRAPTLVVAGTSGLVHPAHTRDIADCVPDVQVKVLEGHDHDPSVVPRAAPLIPAFLDAS